MEITSEIEEIFSDADQVSELELTYKNGGKVNGRLRRVKLNPLRLVVLKSNPAKGERPKHRVVFDHVISLKLAFRDGSVKEYS